MVSWLGKDEQDFCDFGDLGSDFDHVGDLGLVLVLILVISVIWGRF